MKCLCAHTSKGYKKRSGKFFKFGRVGPNEQRDKVAVSADKPKVFKLLWSEPPGWPDRDDGTDVSESRQSLSRNYDQELPREVVREGRFGEHIYSKIR